MYIYIYTCIYIYIHIYEEGRVDEVGAPLHVADEPAVEHVLSVYLSLSLYIYIYI